MKNFITSITIVVILSTVLIFKVYAYEFQYFTVPNVQSNLDFRPLEHSQWVRDIERNNDRFDTQMLINGQNAQTNAIYQTSTPQSYTIKLTSPQGPISGGMYQDK